jgi:hypothetical protein
VNGAGTVAPAPAVHVHVHSSNIVGRPRAHAHGGAVLQGVGDGFPDRDEDIVAVAARVEFGPPT